MTHDHSSHCNSFPHSPCYKIFTWIETGMANSNWSNTHKESCSISCFVIKGILLVMFLGMSEGISEEPFYCFPKILQCYLFLHVHYYPVGLDSVVDYCWRPMKVNSHLPDSLLLICCSTVWLHIQSDIQRSHFSAYPQIPLRSL